MEAEQPFGAPVHHPEVTFDFGGTTYQQGEDYFVAPHDLAGGVQGWRDGRRATGDDSTPLVERAGARGDGRDGLSRGLGAASSGRFPGHSPHSVGGRPRTEPSRGSPIGTSRGTGRQSRMAVSSLA